MDSPRVQFAQWESQEQSERTLAGPMFVWLGGIVAPLAVALWGLSCIIRQESLMMGPRGGTMLYGIDAIAMGLALVGLAGVLHFQCFWDGLYDSTCRSARGKLACLLVMGACAYFLCFRMAPGLLG